MKPEQGPDITRVLMVGGLILLSLLLLMRVYPPMAFMAFAIGSTIGFFLLGGKLAGVLGNEVNLNPRRKRKETSEFSARVSERLDDCRRREENFRDEGERILKSIAALRDDLSRSGSVTDEEQESAQKLISELEAEFSLRHAKATFFADCSKRLKELLDRHRLVESMAARRRELRELRTNNFDDEAIVEETRFNIEQDTIQLDTIVELSDSAVSSSKTEQTEALRDRLERLRQSLGKSEGKKSSS